MEKDCVLHDKKCDECGECLFCDYDPLKLCDNCCKCLDFKDDAIIKIDRVEKPNFNIKNN